MKRPRMKLSTGPNRAIEPRAARAAAKNNGSDQQNKISETPKSSANLAHQEEQIPQLLDQNKFFIKISTGSRI
jgi:DNA-binding FadR family transcriptional regulator